MVRKDCFGYDARCEVRKKARCTALNNLYCENENCKFYKTRDEYERQERRKDGSHEWSSEKESLQGSKWLQSGQRTGGTADD